MNKLNHTVVPVQRWRCVDAKVVLRHWYTGSSYKGVLYNESFLY
jgi:hypothetical protein